MRLQFQRLLFLLVVSTLGPIGGACAQSLEKLESIAAKAKTLEQFLSSPILRTDYFLALKAYYQRDKFRCQSYEQILRDVGMLSKTVPGFKERVWEVRALPSVSVTTLPTQDDLFAKAGARNQYVFKPAQRRFHGLWNDPSNIGCVVEACAEGDLTTPNRWVTAFQDSEVYYLEKNGIYTDRSLLASTMVKGNKKYRYLVPAGGPGMAKILSIEDPKTKLVHSATLIHTWMLRMMARGDSWRQFAFVDRGDLTVRKSTVGRGARAGAGIPLGEVGEFLPADTQFADVVAAAAPRNCPGAKLLSGKEARALASNGKSDSPGNKKQFELINPLAPENVDSVVKALGEVPPLSGSAGPFASLSGGDKESAVTTLSKIFKTDPNPETRARAATAVGELGRSRAAATRRGSASLLEAGLKDPSDLVKNSAALGLVQMGVANSDALRRLADAAYPRKDPTGPSYPANLAGLNPVINKVFSTAASNELSGGDPAQRGVNRRDARAALDRMAAMPPEARARTARELARLLADPNTPFEYKNGLLDPQGLLSPDERAAQEQMYEALRKAQPDCAKEKTGSAK